MFAWKRFADDPMYLQIFLKEPFTIGKGLAITSIVIGLIIVKAG